MIRALFNGFVGAVALTTAHQALRRALPDAPQLDRMGMKGVAKVCNAVGRRPPTGSALFLFALLGDILTNTFYFSQVGSKPGLGSLGKGLSLGLSAGLGAAALPVVMSLDSGARRRTRRTGALTVGLFLCGGLAAAMAAQCAPRR
ncbi:MAG: hypothetical protein DKT66_24815 [Candidatus Melainabacteria bacterium]|jgi:hypothetical protein|nr:MAG: hypothetical protein DKT66_24815 [Candidatus Melainabacteria bacterium]